MKKILLFIVALVATLSMNAQTTEIYKGAEKVATYSGADVKVTFGTNSITVKQGEVEDSYEGPDYNVVSKELPPSPAGSFGTAKRTDDIDVNWVQLWEGGPKFAEYNVGAANNKAEDYGGYYCWGKATDKASQGAYKDGTSALTGTDDTATNLWGSNWRMPTNTDFSTLISNCTCTWERDYNGTGVNGLLCTGKGDYISNSIFLPAAGVCNCGTVYNKGVKGEYWSSTPDGSNNAYELSMSSVYQYVNKDGRGYGFSVRAVLEETPATTGTAKATIGGSQVDVKWVQLWKDGPKFAEYNATEAGWGANWCTPSKDDLEHLLNAASGKTDEKVTCEHTSENSVWGFKFTGKEDGYTNNSVFFPNTAWGSSAVSTGYYWSSTYDSDEDGNEGNWFMTLSYMAGNWYSGWCIGSNDYFSDNDLDKSLVKYRLVLSNK